MSAVTDVVKYCEARVLSKKSKGRGGRRIDEDEHKSLWMSICSVWDDMEGLFAEKGILGTMVTAKMRTDWAKRMIAREMSTILETLQTTVIEVVREGDRSDVEASFGWKRELRALEGVFGRPSGPHPMCDWIDAQITKLQRLKQVVHDMAYSARRMPRGREKVSPMDFVFAVAMHNSAVHLAV